MKRNRSLLRLLALLLTLVLVAAACGDSDDDSDEESSETTEAAAEETTETTEAATETTVAEATTTLPPAPEEETDVEQGTLIWAHEQEPPDLHLDDPNNNLSITSWIRSAMIEGLYGISGSTEYYPELLAAPAEVTVNDDDSATYAFTLRDGLVWSDGEAITSDDVLYTYEIIIEGCPEDESGNGTIQAGEECVYQLGSRNGYDLITDFRVISDTEFEFDMVQFWAGFPALFSTVFAEHAYGTAEEINDNLREFSNADGPLPQSGPMLFTGDWDRGVSLSLERNDSYHGSNSPDAVNDGVAFVEGVQINFVSDTDAQINALLAGEAQIIMTQPQLEFERLAESDDFTVASEAGPVYEHWGFNLFNEHLADPNVREALAYALDKNEIMAGLYTPLFGDSLPSAGLGQTYWMSNQSAYIDFQTEYDGPNIEAAAGKLEESGYTLDGDFYTHPERGQLTLRVGTTGGNRLRELQQEIIQQQMADAGIEIVIDNVPGAAYFGERPFSEEALACANSGGTEGDCSIWDLTQFAWVGGPWPGSGHAAFLSGSGNNPYGFADADFDAKTSECDAIVDDTERAACYNELAEWVATVNINAEQGLVVLPLTQKPSFYGYLSSQLSGAGVAPDAQGAGPLTNVVDFQFG